ncbi:MAG: LLM class F420-dependent oxidoreductase [Dehalococcoidia bacterium]
MDIGLMVEGQDGLTWERWSHILALAERLGFPTLFRSDHYFIRKPQDSLEAYLSLVLAARETQRIRFGPLVTPVTFREPVNVGRMAAQLDVLSGGRFVMGLGAGWNEAEHVAYGLAFPPVKERFDRLEEAILLMRRLWNDEPASFDGRFYQLKDADCLPKPTAGRPPILIGGVGERRTLRLVAKYASEWNSFNLSPEQYAQKVAVLEQHCEAEGRDPATIRRSMMAFGLIGPSQSVIDETTRDVMTKFREDQSLSLAGFRKTAASRGMISGGTDEVVDLLGRLAERGLQEVQFQHLFFDRDDVPEYLAAEIAPKVAGF